MKKKKIIKILAIILAIVIVIIGVILATKKFINNSKQTYSLGDTVETDIAIFKLTAGEYTYALSNHISSNDFALPKEYDATEDSNNPYVAAKGHTLAAFTFYIENLDRTYIDIGEYFASVTYEENNYSASVKFLATSTDRLNWTRNTSNSINILVHNGTGKYIRAYIDLPIDVKNLDDSLELTIYLPNSEGKTEEFTYIVTEDIRNNFVDE